MRIFNNSNVCSLNFKVIILCFRCIPWLRKGEKYGTTEHTEHTESVL